MLAKYGILLGGGLVLLATVVAFAIIGRAARSVSEFRHDQHEAFSADKP